jgi:hypothetical protein
MNTLLDSIISFRQELVAHRAAVAQHKQLVRELSAYTSVSDRVEIDAIVARYPEEDTVEVRRILVSLAA